MDISFVLTTKILPTLCRFLPTFCCCVMFCCLAIYANHNPGKIEATEFLLCATLLGSGWFTVSQLFVEKKPTLLKAFYYGVSAFILMTLSFYFYPLFVECALLVIAAIALVPVAPFITRAPTNDNIFVFSFTIIKQMVLGFIISAIVFVGSVAILVSMRLLFFPEQHDRIVIDVGIAIGSLIFSFITLAGVPKDAIPQHGDKELNFVYSLISYLVIPLLFFYGGILHWYFVQLTMTLTLPQGIIVSMVSGFGLVGIAVYCALSHSEVSKTTTIVIFQRHFFKALLIPLFLMAKAINVRIAEYGLSTARCMVVMLLLWFLLVTIFSFVKLRVFMNQFIFLSAACVAVVTAFII